LSSPENPKLWLQDERQEFKKKSMPSGIGSKSISFCLFDQEPAVCDGCFDAFKKPKTKATIKEK